MVNARGIGPLGLLAVGLGIGAASTATPGIASADSSTDPFSWLGGIDPLPAATTPALDIQISIDGTDLFPATGNTAQAFSGMGDIAIAIGNGSYAGSGAGTSMGQTLTPGLFDIAVANGTNSLASAGQGNFDSAFADGANSIAAVGGFNDVSSNGDWAAAIGQNTDAESGVFTNFPSQNDGALVFDPFGTLYSNAQAGDGNSDFASVFGANSTAYAGGNGAENAGGPYMSGNFDLASVFGNSSHALAGANTGAPGDFDLGAVFGDGFGPTTAATGGNFLVDILPSLFGDSATTSGGNFLTDLLSLF